MKLPASLILKALENFVIWDTCETAERIDEKQLYSRPYFWQEDINCKDDSIVLVEKNDIQNPDFRKSNALFIIDRNLSVNKNKIIHSGQIKSHTSMNEIANRLHDLFNYYEEWESRLSSLVFSHNALTEMVQHSRTVLKNPILIMNAQFHISAASDSMLFFQKHGLQPADEKGYLPVDIVNFYKNDKIYQGFENESEPFYYAEDILPRKVLCQNLFCHGQFAARIIVESIEHDFYEWDSFLLNVLTRYLQLVFLNGMGFEEENSLMMELFTNLLHGIPVAKSDIMQFAASRNWNLSDYYRICVLLPSSSDLTTNTLNYFCHRLTTEFANCIAIHEAERIIILFCLGKEIHFSETLNQRLLLFIREANFRMGLSDSFNNLDALSFYYKEAVIALSYGLRFDSDIWCHTFQHYALDYILDKCCSELPAGFLCAEEIRILNQYDADNNTDLNRTLKTFLKNNQNSVHTAKELYIQRGTLQYRLKRIQQLTGIRFDHPERLLYLMISYAMNEEK